MVLQWRRLQMPNKKTRNQHGWQPDIITLFGAFRAARRAIGIEGKIGMASILCGFRVKENPTSLANVGQCGMGTYNQ
jgi:hypothetical protein